MHNFSDKSKFAKMGSSFKYAINKSVIPCEQDASTDIKDKYNNINCEIKWFNNDKGYGFATATNINRDIFVHVSKIHDAHIDICLIPGDVIECDVEACTQKHSVVKVHKLVRNDVSSNNMIKVKAIVKWFNHNSDCGFVNNGHYDIFVSGILLRKMNISHDRFYEGVEVECHFVEVDCKKIAQNIRVLSQYHANEQRYA